MVSMVLLKDVIYIHKLQLFSYLIKKFPQIKRYFMFEINKILRSDSRQTVNGSPVYCSGHEQIGLWFITLHMACLPQG